MLLLLLLHLCPVRCASGCQAGRVARRKRDAALPLADTRRATRLSSLSLCFSLSLFHLAIYPLCTWLLHANWQTSAELAYRDRPAIFANYDARLTPREPTEPRSPIPCPLISKRPPCPLSNARDTPPFFFSISISSPSSCFSSSLLPSSCFALMCSLVERTIFEQFKW